MKRSVRLLIIVAKLSILSMFGLIASFQQQVVNAQSVEKMRAIVDQNIELWNTGNLAMVDELYAPEFVRYNVAYSTEVKGIEAFKKYVASVRTTYPDFNVKVDELIIKDNRLVVRWTYTGTNTGPLTLASDELPPTGKEVEESGASVVTIVNGKIAEEWAYWNQASVLTQLGFNITPPSPTSQE